jgi:hypothetical protein
MVWLVAVGLAAAATPPALAAEGGAPPLPDPTELAAGIIAQAGVGVPLPTLPVELPVAQTVELPAAPAQQAAVEPVQTGVDAALPPLPVAELPSQPAPEAALQQTAPTPDAPAPVAVQQEPTNVNVAIRVDSPGDDGAVAQVNVAVAPVVSQYQPNAPQYQPVLPAPDAPVTAPEPVEVAPTASDPAWEWSFNWDCGGGGLDPISVPAGVSMQNWNWIWNWNCGGDSAANADSDAETSDGYHAMPVQYRPVNINVSIRINSPGNNGPVVQTNVAVGVSVPLPVTAPVPTPAANPAPNPAPATPAPAAPPAAPTALSDGVAHPEPAAEEPLSAAAPSETASSSAQTHDCCLLPELRGKRPSPESPAGVLAGGGAASATGIASLPGDTVAVAARLELQVRRAATTTRPQRPQLRAAQPRPGRPAPQRRDTDEDPTAATQSGLGIAPVGGPERSLPFAALALLAFAFASANSSLASARSRPTHGADADEPPDRPG